MVRLKVEMSGYEAELDGTIQQIDSYARTMYHLSENAVREATGDLDDTIYEVHTKIAEDTLTMQDINYYIGYLPTLIYFCRDHVERIGYALDAAVAVRKDKYDRSYEVSPGKTIPEKEALTRKEIVAESALENMHKRAYKHAYAKLEDADSLLASLKRLQQSRMEGL